MLKKKQKDGFTLVELMVVVAIIGILAVLAIVGVKRYIANSKTTEARNSLGAISKGVASYFATDSASSTPLAPGATAQFSNSVCGGTTAVPGTKTNIAGKKYQSSNADWGAGMPSDVTASQAGNWNCIGFSMDQPQYYVYQYFSQNPRSGTDTYTARANGDLDGDGNYSTFEIYGAVVNNQLTTSPTISEQNPLD